MKLPSSRSDDTMELKMTPMIDVVFLLLIFFVWTSSFEVPEFDLPGAIAEPPAGGRQLSEQTPPSAEAFDELIIRLTMTQAAVRIELNGDPVEDMEGLRRRLAEIIELGVQPPVIVDPADEITMNVAVAAYDAARASGVDRVLFAAQP